MGSLPLPDNPGPPVSNLVCLPPMTLRALPAVEAGPQAPGGGPVLSTFVYAGSFLIEVVKSLLVRREGIWFLFTTAGNFPKLF